MEPCVREQEWRKDTLDPKGDHIPKEETGEAEAKPLFRANRWRPHTHLAPRRGTQGEDAGSNLLEGVSLRNHSKPKNTAPTRVKGLATRRPRTKPTKMRESLRYDRGRRKNTVPTWDRWPHRKDPEPRRTEKTRAAAALIGQHDRPLPENRTTPPGAQQRREENQGPSANQPEPSANTGSESKETPARSPRNPRSLDNKAVRTGKQTPRGQGKESPPPPPPHRREDPTLDRSLPTQAWTNARGWTPGEKQQKERVQQEGKGTESRSRNTKGAQPPGAAGGRKRLRPNNLPNQSLRRTNRHSRRKPNKEKLQRLHKRHRQRGPPDPQARSTPTLKQGKPDRPTN